MKRRDFLGRAAALGVWATLAPLAGCGDDDADGAAGAEGEVVHILPTASHDRLLVKASFAAPQDPDPELLVEGRAVRGVATDSAGLFWAFDAAGLRPGRPHTLRLQRGRRALTDAWQLATLPAPDASPRRFRLLAYTCAGGHDVFGFYLPRPIRQRLLERALSFAPDAVVANGDHVYWDLRAGIAAQVTGKSPLGVRTAGVFDRTASVIGTANEGVLLRAVGPQLAELYGTRLRGVPVFFLRDDHDYFEDDQVTPAITSFPPDAFMVELARATQWLYYPEFLPDPTRPLALPGSDEADRPPGVSQAFGTLRWGRLFEGLLYDCKGFMTLGADAGLVPRAVESWLQGRMRVSDAAHVVHLPSNPPGWTAGKYAEWYPDVLGDDGRLTVDEPKPGWQPGWLAQHDRLLAAASAMDRVPLVVSGDIHSIAEGRILRSGNHDFTANPIVSLITGTPGTGVGWPSAARGTLASPPLDLDVESTVAVQEVNGFHLLDIEAEAITIRHFRWRRGVDAEDAIDTLEPFQVTVHAR